MKNKEQIIIGLCIAGLIVLGFNLIGGIVIITVGVIASQIK